MLNLNQDPKFLGPRGPAGPGSQSLDLTRAREKLGR